MRTAWLAAAIVATVALLASVAGYAFLRSQGLSARHKPGRAETFAASYAVHFGISNAARAKRNPVIMTPDALLEARRLYSENCAVCHAMHGSGQTLIAQGLSPGVPDLASARVQGLNDGEIYYIIRNGVRFTGMPAWDFADEQVWELVAQVRSMSQP
jgi:hypothetical protein